MPTLIRLLIVLVVLAGLAIAGMFALTLTVDPGEKDITIKIPARELVPPPDADPFNVNALPDPVNVAPRDDSAAASSEAPVDASDVQTLSPGAPE